MILLAVSFITITAHAQTTTDTPPVVDQPSTVQTTAPQFASPKATMKTFMTAMDQWYQSRSNSQLAKAAQCMILSKAEKDLSDNLVIELWSIINRLEEIDWEDTPIPNTTLASIQKIDAYRYFPHKRESYQSAFAKDVAKAIDEGIIELVKMPNGNWKFSSMTIGNIGEIYRRVDKFNPIASLPDERTVSLSHRLRSLVPESLRKESIFSVELWQWVGLLIIILLGVTCDHTTRFFLRRITNTIARKQHAKVNTETVSKMVRPLGLMAAGILWLILARLLLLPDRAQFIVLAAARTFSILAGTWSAWRITDLACEFLALKAAATATKFDDVLVPLFRKTIKILIVVFGLIYTADSLFIPIMPMLTGLGIGSLAFAFAAKDTIENFFGSVAVILDRPFEVGDWVVIGDTEGTVEEVGFRSTRVRTFYNSQLTIPNSTLVRATVDNLGRRQYRRWKTHIGVQYDTTPEQLVAFTEGIRELVRCHPYTRKDYFQVYLHQFGSSSLDILIYVFHETPDWSTELRERERLFLDIVRLASRLGVSFAFPTQTLHLHQSNPNDPHTPVVIPEQNTEGEAQMQGIKEAQDLIANQPWQEGRPGAVKFTQGPTEVDG